MKNLFSQMLDAVDHVMNSDLEKVANVVSTLSDNVKTAYIPSYDEELNRKENDFAVVLWDGKLGQLKKYACYNPQLTELNMAFLIDKMEQLPEEIVKTAAKNLTAAAKKFKLDIPEELNKYASSKFVPRLIDISTINQTKHMEKISSKKEDTVYKYALQNKYPIDTPSGIEKAAEWFDRNYTKLTLDEIMEFSNNVYKEATNQKVSLENTKIAEYSKLVDDTFNEDFYNHIQIRKAQLKDDNEEGVEVLNDLVRRADELGVEKIACILEVIDKELGLDEYYGTHILPPIESVYGMKKIASVKIGNKNITHSMIKSADMDELSILVGNDIVKELRGPEGLQIFESLPTPIKIELSRVL